MSKRTPLGIQIYADEFPLGSDGEEPEIWLNGTDWFTSLLSKFRKTHQPNNNGMLNAIFFGPLTLIEWSNDDE